MKPWKRNELMKNKNVCCYLNVTINKEKGLFYLRSPVEIHAVYYLYKTLTQENTGEKYWSTNVEHASKSKRVGLFVFSHAT